jgi:hypothetical protein
VASSPLRIRARSSCGEPGEAAPVVDERDAEIALELGQPGRERRLAGVTALRRAPEVLLAGQRDEVLELAHQHVAGHTDRPRSGQSIL